MERNSRRGLNKGWRRAHPFHCENESRSLSLLQRDNDLDCQLRTNWYFEILARCRIIVEVAQRPVAVALLFFPISTRRWLALVSFWCVIFLLSVSQDLLGTRFNSNSALIKLFPPRWIEDRWIDSTANTEKPSIFLRKHPEFFYAISVYS